MAGSFPELLAGWERRAPSLEGALAITAAKSASLVAAACRLGAHCAGAGEAIETVYAEFGRRLGTAEQLANDLAALHPGARHNTDIAFGRPTLPLTYERLYPGDAGQGGSARSEPPSHPSGGGGCLAWAVAETHRRRAVAMVDRLAETPRGRAGLAALLPVLS
jgi:geranylgeranyl pyrophosphate synthase